MELIRDWLWDKKTTLKRARAILNNSRHERFVHFAGLLLARKNTPKEVFKYYLKPTIFVNNWQKIKREMRKDSWNNPRIEYWQIIYEAVRKKLEKRGIKFEREKYFKKEPSVICKTIADKIKSVRIEKGLTQGELAGKLKVSQQIISRIENGRENISLCTLKGLADALDAQLQIEIRTK